MVHPERHREAYTPWYTPERHREAYPGIYSVVHTVGRHTRVYTTVVHTAGRLYPGVIPLYSLLRKAIPGCYSLLFSSQGGYTRVLYLLIYLSGRLYPGIPPYIHLSGRLYPGVTLSIPVSLLASSLRPRGLIPY